MGRTSSLKNPLRELLQFSPARSALLPIMVVAFNACAGTGPADSGVSDVSDAAVHCAADQECTSPMHCSLEGNCRAPRTTVVDCATGNLPAAGDPCSDVDAMAGAWCRPIGGCYTNCERELDCGPDRLWHAPGLTGSACRDPGDSAVVSDPRNAGPRCVP